MLVLALADFNATREMGPILALGVAVMVVAGLTLLPAILATLGRRAFWPAIPRVETTSRAGRPTIWRRVGAPGRRAAGGDGGGRDRDPGRRARSATLGGREPLAFSEAFREAPESVLGEQLICDALHPRAGRAAERRDRLRRRRAR